MATLTPVTDQALLSRLSGLMAQQAPIDASTGAPPRVRAAVGSSPSQDQLAALRQYYPDAQPYEDGNYIYTDPKTNRRAVMNPSGLDAGDVAAHGRVAAEMAGGAVGGVLATPPAVAGIPASGGLTALAIPAGVAIGSEVGGQAFDAGMNIFGGRQDTRSPVNSTVEATTNVMANMGLQKGFEDVGGAIRKALTRGKNEIAGATSGEIVRAAERMGVDLQPAMISTSQTIQGVTNAAMKAPISSDMVQPAYRKTIDQLKTYNDNIVKALTGGDGGRESAGTAISAGVDAGLNRFKAQANILYGKVGSAIPANAKIEPTNFRAALGQSAQRFADNPEFKEGFDSAFISKLKSMDKGSDFTWKTLSNMRTEIGAKLDDELMGDASNAELKRLYAALSSDMESMATAHPNAKSYFDAASGFWKAGRDVIDNQISPLVRKKLPEQIYASLYDTSKRCGTQINTLLGMIPEKNRQRVVGEVLHEMGRSTPGKQSVDGDLFSPATFVTNYAKLPPKTKDALFKGEYTAMDGAMRRLADSVKDVATVSGSIKDMEKMANSSGTAGQSVFMAVISGGFAGGAFSGNVAEAATAAAIGGSTLYGTGKLLTSPAFINWLANSAKAGTPAQIQGQMVTLRRIAAGNSNLEKPINSFIENMLRTTEREQPQSSSQPSN